MAIEPPKKEDLRRIANENHFELSDSEADAIGAMLAPIIGFLDRIDQTPIEPSPSVRRYRDRDAGTGRRARRILLMRWCAKSASRARHRASSRASASG